MGGVSQDSLVNPPEPAQKGGPKRALCPVCQGPGQFSFSASDTFYRVTDFVADQYRCQSCGVLFIWPRPRREQVSSFYPSGYWRESEARSWLDKAQRTYVSWVLAWDLGTWLKRLKLGSKARFLDIGCSRGDALGLAKRFGWVAEGLEADPRAAAFARKRHQLEVQVQDVEAWLPEAEAWDGMMAFHLLEHLIEPRVFLQNCHLGLRQGGVLLLRVPNEGSWQRRVLGRHWKGLEIPRHLTHFHPKALGQLLLETGFRVKACSTWSLRDGPPALASSLFPKLEPTWREIHGKKASFSAFLYLVLTWGLLPLEYISACLRRGAMVTFIAIKE